jgi:ribosome-associated protein
MTEMDRLTKASVIHEAALDRKAMQVVCLDVREVSSFADTFIIATGTSDRHLRSIADSIQETLNHAGERPLGVEGYQEGGWILIDCDDVIVHLFQHELRENYDLERLWSDGPVLELEPAVQRVGP